MRPQTSTSAATVSPVRCKGSTRWSTGTQLTMMMQIWEKSTSITWQTLDTSTDVSALWQTNGNSCLRKMIEAIADLAPRLRQHRTVEVLNACHQVGLASSLRCIKIWRLKDRRKNLKKTLLHRHQWAARTTTVDWSKCKGDSTRRETIFQETSQNQDQSHLVRWITQFSATLRSL